jgi:aspartyl protease family protein
VGEWLDSFGIEGGSLVYLLLALAIVAPAGLAALGQRRGAMQVLAWGAIIGGLWFAIDRMPLLQRALRGDGRLFAGGTGHELRIAPAEDGHYWVRADIDGHPVRFMVDTGATEIGLSLKTAERIGINPAGLEFSGITGTAAGPVPSARARLGRISVGGITRDKPSVTILKSPDETNLLGMAFLSTLSSWRVERGTLILVD